MIKELTKGEPLKLIIIFSITLLIGNNFQQLYNKAELEDFWELKPLHP